MKDYDIITGISGTEYKIHRTPPFKPYTNQNIKRITIDLDTVEYFKLSHCMVTLFNHGFDTEITIKKSPSKRGYHVIAWSQTGVETKEELIKIRREAGDDPMRCDLDSRRQINVLFDKKKKRSGRQINVLFDKKKKRTIYG